MMKLHMAASVAALGAALTGCAATPNFPVALPSSTPQQAAPAPAPANDIDSMTGPDAAPRAAPSGSIDSGVLPPTGSYGARQPAPQATELPPIAEPAYVAPRAAAPARPVARPQASGKVVTDAPPPVKVGKGDTLIAISRKTGLSVEVLARTNGLKSPYALKLGQLIKLPAKRYYAVQPGDTLFAIAKRFSMETADLAEFNEFSGTAIKPGQKIYLPADAKDKGPPPAPRQTVVTPAPRPAQRPPTYTAPAYTPPAYTPPPYTPPAYAPPPYTPPAATVEPTPSTPRTPIPYRPSNTSPSTSVTPRPQTPEVSAPPTDAQITAAGRGRFVWPVRGEVLSRFGPTGGGQRNDGVNIAAGPGEGVRAAAKGEVVYAGNQVPGFGNLVLIKHDGGWVTAYAHLSNIDVKMRQAIAQGQVIGQVGQTGTVDQPQLHFEIRYAPTPKDKARPVDPTLVLPR